VIRTVNVPRVVNRAVFAARHDLADADAVVGVLELLEGIRERLAALFPVVPDEVAVVVHDSAAGLDMAAPYLPLVRRLTAPAARRYLVGWFSASEVHVLAPRVLEARASHVPGSRELNLLAPAALYTHVVLGANNPRLPPPFTPRAFGRYPTWAWLAAGAAQWLSGQTLHVRPAIARRMHEGPRPAFPPGMRDAQLLGGTVVDLLAREEGDRRAARPPARAAAERPPARARAGLPRARARPHRGDLALAPRAPGGPGPAARLTVARDRPRAARAPGDDRPT
jgi:hypothetical protein